MDWVSYSATLPFVVRMHPEIRRDLRRFRYRNQIQLRTFPKAGESAYVRVQGANPFWETSIGEQKWQAGAHHWNFRSSDFWLPGVMGCRLRAEPVSGAGRPRNNRHRAHFTSARLEPAS